MSYEDWDESFRELFDLTPGMADAIEEDPTFDVAHAEALFEMGFTHSADEYDAFDLSPQAVEAIREEFFDYMGLDAADFDWEEWREAMGYE